MSCMPARTRNRTMSAEPPNLVKQVCSKRIFHGTGKHWSVHDQRGQEKQLEKTMPGSQSNKTYHRPADYPITASIKMLIGFSNHLLSQADSKKRKKKSCGRESTRHVLSHVFVPLVLRLIHSRVHASYRAPVHARYRDIRSVHEREICAALRFEMLSTRT